MPEPAAAENRVATQEMLRKVPIAFLLMIAFPLWVSASFLNVCPFPTSAERYFVTRVLEAKHLVFNRDMGATSFVFQFAKGDSMKIVCPSSRSLMASPAERGGLTIVLKSASGNVEIRSGMLDRWIALPGNGGKVALVFERDGLGEKVFAIDALTVFCKSADHAQAEAGKAIGLVEVNHLCLPKKDLTAKGAETTFLCSFREEDSYRVRVVGVNGAATTTFLGNVFKLGEEFALQPLVLDAPSPLPASGSGIATFGFAFAEVASVKGLHSYHIDIDRIPLHSTWESSTQDR